MRGLRTATVILVLAAIGATADPVPTRPLTEPAPLSQSGAPVERIAMARVTGADGAVIGSVRKVDMRDGRPGRIAIALLGSENSISLDAAAVRYDAGRNLVLLDQSADALRARPQS